MPLTELRREYNLTGLRRRDLDADPIAQFRVWFDQAAGARGGGRLRKFFVNLYKSLLMLAGAETADVNAMTLATADKEGRPSARVVLLKGVDDRGFIFFTNYDSRKGRELAENPQGALVFYWPDLERQVCIAGPVERLSREESEAYFRPRGSQVAACASDQSAVIADRNVLEERFRQIEAEFANRDLPIPPNWGGYV